MGKTQIETADLVSVEQVEALKAKARKHLWQFGTSLQIVTHAGGPLVFSHGEGCHLFDMKGQKYIDGTSGVWVVNAGHKQQAIIDAMSTQASQLAFALSEEGYSNIRAIELAEKLTSIMPGSMERVYFTCGGSDAVEIALRFARFYHALRGHEKKKKILARQESYHGSTLFTLTVSGIAGLEMLSRFLDPKPEGIVRCVQPYCYRCPFDTRYPECNCQCAQDVEDKILREGPETVATFIAEPISLSSRLAIPPRAYWERIRRICDEYDILLIADEIVTGFGRTGTLFGMEQFGVNADITTISKGLTSGYAPLGGVVMSRKVTEQVPDHAFLLPGFTFTGHPVSCTAALANIEIINQDTVLENTKTLGMRLKHRLLGNLGTHPFVGDIRGIGLLLCLEIVQNKETKEKFPFEMGITELLSQYFRKKGLHTRLIMDDIHLAPPLVATEEIIDEMAHIVEEGLNMLVDHVKNKHP